MREERLRRYAAGLLHAVASLLFGAAGHLAAGGVLPGVRAAAVVLAVLTAPSCVFALRARRRRGFETAVVGTGAQQVLLHLAFHTLSSRPADPSRHAGHPGLPEHAHQHATGGLDAVTAMGAAHLLATLGAVLVLLRGERLLRRLVRLLTRGPRRPASAVVPCPEAARAPLPDGPPPVAIGVRLARSRTRRGPPR